MCSNKYLCIGVVEKLLKAKRILSDRISKEIKINNYNGIEHIVEEQVNRVYNEIFMMENINE